MNLVDTINTSIQRNTKGYYVFCNYEERPQQISRVSNQRDRENQ
jgi:hypothetical protein